MGIYWVSCTFELHHDDAKMIDRFVDAFNDNRLFEAFIPLPAELAGKRSSLEFLDWCDDNWGACQPETPDHPPMCRLEKTAHNTVKFRISTEGMAPFPFFEKLSVLGYQLEGVVQGLVSCDYVTYRNGHCESRSLIPCGPEELEWHELNDDPHEIPT